MELAGTCRFPPTFFTTLAPLGAGAFSSRSRFRSASQIFRKTSSRRSIDLTIIPLLVALVGLIASFFHLANPGHALNIANTVGSTPLANEITAFGIFMIVAAVYWIVALAGGLKNNSARKGFALVAGILGLIAALFIGLAYAIPTIPTRNNFFWTPLSIIGFTFFGGTSLGLLITTLGVGAGDARSVKGQSRFDPLRYLHGAVQRRAWWA